MNALLSKLPAFALPFVTRSLRGGRGRRYLILSLVLASLTGIIGVWLALGDGRFEQEMRTEFKLELWEHERSRDTFTVYTHDKWDHDVVEEELGYLVSTPDYEDSQGRYYSPASDLYSWGRAMVALAATAPAYHPDHQRLRARAQQLIGHRQIAVEPWMAEFAWGDPREVARLETILDHDGIPSVEVYRSPLSFVDALKITGFFAGLGLAALLTVFLPLLAAVQQAQERHENTLMPLTGTALGPRELAVGLAAGPVAVIAIFAGPQLLLFGICALLAGEVFVAGALLAALAATSALFVFGGQLFGQLMGQRRTPGIIGMSLMAVLGISWLLGGGLAADAEHELAGFSAVMPHIGLSALLAEVFIDVPADFSRVFLGAFAWTGGAIVMGWLAMTALARKIEDRDGPLLTRSHALIGALTCVVLVNVALPQMGLESAILRQYLGLGMLALPFLLLTMARVPLGDAPPRMRRVAVPALLLELGAWTAAHVIFAGLFWGFASEAMHPVSLMWMAWCVAVLGLIGIRVVVSSTKIATNVWTGFCAMSLTVGFGQALFWALERSADIEDVFALMNVSPVLGLIQISLTIWIPLSLIRHLRANLGRIV